METNDFKYWEHTEQEVFDHVVGKLFNDQRRVSIMNNCCAYRGPGGLKCAAGHCFPDELYDPKMDPPNGISWGDLVQKFNLPTEHFEFIESLQHCHDEATYKTGDELIKEWSNEFHKLSVEYELDKSYLDECEKNWLKEIS